MTDDNELVTVFTAYREENAEVVRLALAAEGIDAVVDNAHQAGLTGILPAHVLVRASDAQRASDLIKEHEKRDE